MQSTSPCYMRLAESRSSNQTYLTILEVAMTLNTYLSMLNDTRQDMPLSPTCPFRKMQLEFF